MTASLSRSRLGRKVCKALVAGLAAIALTVACGGDNVSQAERAVAPTPIPTPPGVDADGQERTLEVVDGGEVTGLVITDHRGFAVYGVAGESTDGSPTCVDDCLDVWIPVEPRGAGVSDLLEESRMRTWERPDGITQVVYADVPLYLWSGDREIGITAGAGVAGIWFALTEAAGFIDAPAP